MSPDADRSAALSADEEPVRMPVEIGPAPDPDPTRRWAVTVILALVAAVVVLRRILR